MSQSRLRSPATEVAAANGRRSLPDALRHARVLESLQFRDFRWLFLGSFGSFMGMNMEMITRGWLVLRIADDSPLALSLVMMSFSLPMTVVSVVAGALADRVPRKRLVMWSHAGKAAMLLILATLDVMGLVEFWHLLAIGVANGSLMALNMPSRQALISDIVPEGKLMNAISLSNSGMNLTRILGPAMAGFLIVAMGTAGVFYVVAAIYLLAVLSISMMHAGEKPTTRSRNGMMTDIKDGFAYITSDRTLLGLVLMSLIPVLFGFSYWSLLPAWAKEALHVEADGLGVLMMVMGIGALAGTLMLASVPMAKGRGLLLLGACAAWGGTLAAFSQTSSYLSALPLVVVIGFLSSLFMSLNTTLLQMSAAPEMRGRVMSINMMTFGVMPLSAVPFGALAESIGTPSALMWSGYLLLGFTLVFAVAYPAFRKIP